MQYEHYHISSKHVQSRARITLYLESESHCARFLIRRAIPKKAGKSWHGPRIGVKSTLRLAGVNSISNPSFKEESSVVSFLTDAGSKSKLACGMMD